MSNFPLQRPHSAMWHLIPDIRTKSGILHCAKNTSLTKPADILQTLLAFNVRVTRAMAEAWAWAWTQVLQSMVILLHSLGRNLRVTLKGLLHSGYLLCI